MPDLGPIVGTGLVGMCVTLFGFMLRAMITAGTRSDIRNEAEIARVQARADADVRRIARERDYWRERFVAHIEGRPPPTPPTEAPMEAP